MIVLGFDTATPATVVGLRLADGEAIELRDDPAPGEHPGHATRLLAMAHELLAGSGTSWEQLDRIAVGVGPGTFTGLRVGIATARGLAQSRSLELVGVSSLGALAEGAFAALADEQDLGLDDRRRPKVCSLLAVIDARRGEAFAAAYERAADGTALLELAAPAALAPQSLPNVIAAVEERETEREQERGWLAVGDGAVRYREQLESAGVAVPDDRSSLHRVSAAAICELGVAAASPGSRREVVPDYRRRPDAELALETATAVGGDE
jgi:tRNA threonylcarbamoyladenosine biosynthesis protein TsaB